MDEDIKQHRETCGNDMRVISALDTISTYCREHRADWCEGCMFLHFCLHDGTANIPDEWADMVLSTQKEKFECHSYKDGKCHWGCKVEDCPHKNIRQRIFHCASYNPNENYQ